MKLVIDPGHGGKDRWNRGPTGYIEADGVLDIALRLGEILKKDAIEVIYTRTEDINLYWEDDNKRDLYSRATFANEQKADYFISIHTNAASNSEAYGTETFCYKFGGEGEKMARAIQQEVVQTLATRDRGVKEGNFVVLRETNMPAVLIEIAFHTNPKEEQLLKTAKFRALAAEAIARGINNYFKNASKDKIGTNNQLAIGKTPIVIEEAEQLEILRQLAELQKERDILKKENLVLRSQLSQAISLLKQIRHQIETSEILL